uniref:Uncharacterized protein n=1 Tax=Timema bartmani TaxID=61472 RepID=A0A7R9EQP1_9NEOP|nr:unnamed protein product [Timema bartmani]
MKGRNKTRNLNVARPSEQVLRRQPVDDSFYALQPMDPSAPVVTRSKQTTSEDVDCLIVSTAIELSAGKPVAVIVTDTMLAVHALSSSKLSLLVPVKTGKPDKIHSIMELQEDLGPLNNTPLFTHAMTGCVVKSILFRKGKKLASDLLQNDKELSRKELVPAMPFLPPVPEKLLHLILSVVAARKVANVRRAGWCALLCVAVREKYTATTLHRLSLWIVKKTWTT